jgi:HD superfamily phosphohydrolase
MEELGDFIGHFTVQNDDGLDLFKIYFHKNGISFDNKFLKGVIKNKKVCKDFEKINNKWISGSLSKEDAAKLIMKMLEKNQEYLSNFFIDEFSNDTKLYDNESENEIYFKHLKENGKLNKITRKKFESNIKDEKIGDYYVENLEKSKSKSTNFYTYKSKEDKSCFIMVMNDKIKIGFAEK